MKATRILLGLMMVFVLTFAVNSADKPKAKNATLKGKLVCGKCTLGITDGCSNVLQVKAEGKTVNYVLDDAGKKAKYHGKICRPNSGVEVSVTGTVYKKGDQLHIKNPKVKAGKKG